MIWKVIYLSWKYFFSQNFDICSQIPFQIAVSLANCLFCKPLNVTPAKLQFFTYTVTPRHSRFIIVNLRQNDNFFIYFCSLQCARLLGITHDQNCSLKIQIQKGEEMGNIVTWFFFPLFRVHTCYVMVSLENHIFSPLE